MLENRKHTGHYIALILILVSGFVWLKMAYPDKKLQTEILILISLLYVVWGIFHHGINHRLTSKIVIEYILIATLGLAALLFFITGAFGI